ncbi:hypothetical protein [Seonamhaeicola maritimus]|uniref:DUF6630 domain-containing protein n=1 Tax=Seonamhaeicola maritimus TaxID=2591822 RepID=A0A5C7GHA9_9FLAO|nr:hypothetical protein [Seonamhaeicola maritimus]TXG36691.1 hypothetical protein FUA22_08910 [Seonamhaeicola maritimus]
MNYTDSNCIRIDWKEEINETVSLLTQKWTEHQSVFSESKFKLLFDNYNSEPTDEYLLALGQELSTFNLALYNIIEDSDSYCLVLIKEENKIDFERENKKNKISFQLQKQPRKKWGTSAKLINLSSQIPFEKQSIKGHLKLNYPLSVCQERFYTKGGGYEKSKYYFIDTKIWPLEKFETKAVNYTDSSITNNYHCAIFKNELDKTGTIKISKTPFDINTWEQVTSTDKIPTLAFPFWVNNDLLILDKKNVWLVSSVATGNRKCKKILEVNTPRRYIHGEFPRVFKTGNGDVYILLYFVFYKWENRKLIDTGLFAEEHSDFSVFQTGNNRVVYVSKGDLIEIDFKTKKTRKRTLEYMDSKTNIKKYSEDWAVLKRFGRTSKSVDLAQFWHPKTDTWIRMPLGKIGTFGVSDIFLHPDKYTIIKTGKETILKIDNLIEKLKLEPKNILKLDDWDEYWKPELENAKKEKTLNFWSSIKKRLKK